MNNEDELPTCPECGSVLREVWDNVGYSPPDPTHWIVTGYECTECGYKENV